MVRGDGRSVRRLHDRGGQPRRERGSENGAPGEEGGASQGAGSGRDVEARKDHGCSLWPTAKRFSPLGVSDQVVAWLKPKKRPEWMTAVQYAALPGELLVREL